MWRGFARRGAPLEALAVLLAHSPSPASLQPAETLLVRRLEALRRREAAAVWGLAQMLHQRRLMPEPLALLRAPGAAALVLEPSGDLVTLAEAPAVDRRAALVVAIDRLHGLGVDVSRSTSTPIVFSRQHGRVAAARSDALPAGTGECAGGGARRRARARKLLEG